MDAIAQLITDEIISRLETHGITINPASRRVCERIAGKTVVQFAHDGDLKHPPKKYWDKPIFKNFILVVTDKIAENALIEDDSPNAGQLEAAALRVMRSKYIQDRCTATLTAIDGPQFTPVCDSLLQQEAKVS